MLECSSLAVARETFETMIAVDYCGGLCRVILRCERGSENHFMWNIFIMERSDMQPVHNISLLLIKFSIVGTMSCYSSRRAVYIRI